MKDLSTSNRIIPIYKVYNWATKEYTDFKDEEVDTAYRFCDSLEFGTAYKQYYKGGALFWVYGRPSNFV